MILSCLQVLCNRGKPVIPKARASDCWLAEALCTNREVVPANLSGLQPVRGYPRQLSGCGHWPPQPVKGENKHFPKAFVHSEQACDPDCTPPTKLAQLKVVTLSDKRGAA